MDTLFPVDPATQIPAVIPWDNLDISKQRGRSDRLGRHTPENVIPFQPQWFEYGLPVHLHLWVLEHMRPKDKFVGVRWVDDAPCSFVIHRTSEDGYSAMFDLLDRDHYLWCRTGKFELVERATRKVIKRVLQTVADDGSADVEVESEYKLCNYRRNLDRCPANLATAMEHINLMMYEMTGAGRDVTTAIRGFFQDFGDPSYDKLTPPPIRAAWQVLHDLYVDTRGEERKPFPPNLVRYGHYKDRVIEAIMNPSNANWK